MGLAFACRTRSAAPQVTGSHCRKISTSLRMTRRGKADFLFAPYARHKNYTKRKTICINENTYRLILSLSITTLLRIFGLRDTLRCLVLPTAPSGNGISRLLETLADNKTYRGFVPASTNSTEFSSLAKTTKTKNTPLLRSVFVLARCKRFELLGFWSVAKRSIQLS